MKYVLIFICICLQAGIYAQNVGIGTNNPSSEAKLDIQANNQGLLIPRMSSAQRLSIANETASNTTTNGMMVYDMTLKKIMVFDSTANSFNGIWDAIEPSSNIWKTAGNSGTNANVHFIGNIDSTSLNISTNNQSRINIGASGNLGIRSSAIGTRGVYQLFTPTSLDSNNYGYYQDFNLNGAGTGTGLRSQYGRYLNMNVSNTSSFPLGFVYADYTKLNLSDIGETTNYYGAYGQYITLLNNGKNNSSFPSINGSGIEIYVDNDSTTSSISGTFVRAHATGKRAPNRIVGSTIYAVNETADTINSVEGLGLGIYLGPTNISSPKGKTDEVTGVNNILYLRDNHTIQNYYNIKNLVTTGGGNPGGSRINNLYGYHLDINTFDNNDIIDTVKAFYANFDYNTNKRYGLYIKGEGFNFLSGNLGIGVLSPSNKLEVSGNTKTTNFQMTTGAGVNKILQSDASGNASWVTPIDMNTDSQSISLSGSTLSISRGNSININSIDSDSQSISLSGTTLSITRGNSINLSSIETDPQVSSATNNIIPKWNGSSLVDGIITDNGLSVGIDMNPIARLDVNAGNIRVTGLGNTDTSADNDGSGGAIIWNNSAGLGAGLARKVERMTRAQVAVLAGSVINFYNDPYVQLRIARTGSGGASTINIELAPKTGFTGDYSVSSTDGTLNTFISAATAGTYTSVTYDLRTADMAKEFSISRRGNTTQAVYRIIIHKNGPNSGINPENFNINVEAYY